MHSPAPTSLDGGCQCGRIRFRLEVSPIITHCCHCKDCQKASGSAFCINAMIESEHLTVLTGIPQQFQGADSPEVARCADCGGVLWSHHPHFGRAIAFVGVGRLDQAERLAPEAHYFTRSKHPWVQLPPELPAFETLGFPQKPEAEARIGAVMAKQSQ
ncbi:MAG TPA: GFA family protein [Polyangiaceae bacterium]|nr:GFA family protein [Polyangiaceae bacterium]